MKVLVTRPLAQAQATARRLATAGHVAILSPLLRVEALPWQGAASGGDHDAVLVTSANAVRCAPAPLARIASGKLVFAVGDRTATAARGAGWANARAE